METLLRWSAVPARMAGTLGRTPTFYRFMSLLSTPKTPWQKSLVRQHDQRDCGVACLLTLVRYYGGESSFEQIRRLSGADLSGTTLLGLKEAAQQLGFEADGYEADVKSLIEHGQPVILHTELESGLKHYCGVLWYGKRTVSDR